jgi:hypothetical protein
VPLPNRVTPHGEIVAVVGRGLFMGNRGILHDGQRRIVRRAQGRRWITCLTSFRGRRRSVMRPGSYTELFFLDEAVALAAGHRPCAECRHADYQRFRVAWARCFSDRGMSADAIDRRLHTDRLSGPRVRRTYVDHARHLPDGTYVEVDGRAWLLWDGSMLAWSPTGYVDERPRSEADVIVLTPRCTVDVIGAGYRPWCTRAPSRRHAARGVCSAGRLCPLLSCRPRAPDEDTRDGKDPVRRGQRLQLFAGEGMPHVTGEL